MSCTVRWAPLSSFVRSVQRTTRMWRSNPADTWCAPPVWLPGRWGCLHANKVLLRCFYRRCKSWQSEGKSIVHLLTVVNIYLRQAYLPFLIIINSLIVSFIYLGCKENQAFIWNRLIWQTAFYISSYFSERLHFLHVYLSSWLIQDNVHRHRIWTSSIL